MNKLLIFLCLLLLIPVSGCQTSTGGTSGSIEIENKDSRIRIVFSDQDRKTIRSWYKKGKYKKTPPGLAKKEQLPPGLSKHVRKHGTLPPGLQGRYLPHDLERKLERLPRGYVRIIIGTDVVLMNQQTRVVFDVINDAL